MRWKLIADAMEIHGALTFSERLYKEQEWCPVSEEGRGFQRGYENKQIASHVVITARPTSLVVRRRRRRRHLGG